LIPGEVSFLYTIAPGIKQDTPQFFRSWVFLGNGIVLAALPTLREIAKLPMMIKKT
jgi:hypothetical protein